MCYIPLMGDIRDIGRGLVTARRELGITQKELGRRVGVMQPQIARWEATAYRSVSLERVADVAMELAYDAHITGSPSLALEQSAAYRTSLHGAHASALDGLRRTAAPPAAIAAFARSHRIKQLDLFGSILTQRFGPTSDVDVLVTYESGHTPSLLGISDHETELGAIMRRRVDLVSRSAVEKSDNVVRKTDILGSARTLYARP